LKRLKWALVVLALPLAGVGLQRCAEWRMSWPPPGRLVDVGGRHLHIQCDGAGSPTVILEASGLSPSTEWEELLPQIAQHTRACAYDRAGMGWSDPAPAERNADDFVMDLHMALQRAGEHPPYLLVGHSAGGVLVRAFQRRHPDEVRGLVLVDTASQYLFARWPQVAPRMIHNLKLGRWLAALGLLRLANPFHIDGRSAALTYRPRTFAAAQALVAADADELPRLAPPAATTVVLTHARGGDWSGPGVIDAVDEDAVERDWQEGQTQLGGTLLKADHAGHFIPQEEPRLVLRAIEQSLSAPSPPPR
jgi:pimeloyl-ACP methyl ester carboxylesterase